MGAADTYRICAKCGRTTHEGPLCPGCGEVLPPTVQQIVEAWENFKPIVPLAYVLAARKARRRR